MQLCLSILLTIAGLLIMMLHVVSQSVMVLLCRMADSSSFSNSCFDRQRFQICSVAISAIVLCQC